MASPARVNIRGCPGKGRNEIRRVMHDPRNRTGPQRLADAEDGNERMVDETGIAPAGWPEGAAARLGTVCVR